MANPNRWQWAQVDAPIRATTHAGPWRVIAELVIPLVVAALFYARGKVVPAAVVATIGLTLFAVSRASRTAAAKIQGAFAKLGFWVGEVLTWALLLPVFFGIFTPVALWLRVRREDPLDTNLDPRKASYWVNAAHERPKSRYFHQFIDETYVTPPRGGSPLVIRLASAALWLIVLNSLLGFGLRAAGVANRSPLDSRAHSEVYAGATWAEGYFRELAATTARYRPFLGWQRNDFPEAGGKAEFIHVRDGLRETRNAPIPGGTKPLEVFFLGGSTVWGVGSRDAGTLPSAFAAVATAAGLPVHVTNLGEDGYVQWQEVLRLSDLVAAGRTPDLAIFYDGANDVFTHFQSPVEGERERIHQNLSRAESRFLDRHDLSTALRDVSGFHLLLKWNASRGIAPAPRFHLEWPRGVTVEQVAATLARQHREGAAHAARLGHEYGFSVASFWQPTVFTKHALTEEERQHRDAFGENLGALYAGARAAIGNQIVDLGDTFADQAGPVYIDWCHVGEAGNEALARRLFEKVAPLLRARVLKTP